MSDFDLFVIGGGSGGVACARRAAEYGAKVALAEPARMGGTCVHRGCIPKKMLVYAAHFAEDFEDAAAYGWTVGEPTFDWATLIANKDRELVRLDGLYRKLLDDSGVTTIADRATVAGPDTVVVGNRRIGSKRIVIATGGRPQRPEIPGAHHAITSDEAFHLKDLPARIAIVGGGYIAVEFAGIFKGLGAETTLLYRGEMILRGFDGDVRAGVAEGMRAKGIDLRLESNIERIEAYGGGLRATTTRGEVLEVDQVMVATGRAPNTHGLGLREAGVELARGGAVLVDSWSQSSVPSIAAIGDCTDRVNLTPVAIREGRCFAETHYNGNPLQPDHRDVPTAVFSQPPVGTVGLTEDEARAEVVAIDVYRAKFRPLKHTLTGRKETTMIKLVVDRATDRVLGAHMVGVDAPEIVQLLGVLVKLRATKAQFDATVAVHPTAAEEFVTLRRPVG
ncbi:MAG: glutathione-disulfide reductase [Alphaproteobacteria bacterium]|nr:glutathione-disulfide reductase [Alphaproteobacteria bacterium]